MKKKLLAIMSAMVVCMAFIGFNCMSTVSALTVILQVKSISIEKSVLTVGETVPITLEWEYTYGDKSHVSYQSSDPDIADVDYDGNVTAKSPGKAEIIVHNYIYDDKTVEVTVTAPTYPTSFNEYKAFLETYPNFYRIDGDSVYFVNRYLSSAQMSLIVSSNNKLSVSNNTYGYIFSPEEDGSYVVTVEEYREEITETPDEGLGHYHAFYPEIFNYVVVVKNGIITVSYEGTYNWKEALSSNENANENGYEYYEGDVLEGGYFTFVNGCLPNKTGDGEYITTVYGEYSTQSYFCVNLRGKNDPERVTISDNNVAALEKRLETSSSCSGNLDLATPDIINFFGIKALADGKVTVTVDDNNSYPLVVKDGVFYHSENTVTAPTYPTNAKEYEAFVEQYPDFYRIDGDSVYFSDRILGCDISLIVSSNNELSVSDKTYGYIFKPEEDGRYVVTVYQYLSCDDAIDVNIDANENEHWLSYPEIFNYVVDVENGKISVSYKGSRSFEQEVLYGKDILDGSYFSFVNGYIPGSFDKYITTVYGQYTTLSYFCLNLSWKEENFGRIIISDNKVAAEDMSCSTSSAETTDDIMSFIRIMALSDGKVTVTADGNTYYPLVVKDGVFHHEKTAGDVNNDGKLDKADVELLGKWLSATRGVKLADWKAADLNNDGKLNVFDLCLMKRALREANKSETKPMLMMVDYSSGLMLNPYVDISVVDNQGIQYKLHCDYDSYDETTMNILKDLCGNVDYIIENGEKSALITNKDDLSSIAHMVNSSAKYENTEMENWGFDIYDYGSNVLYALYTGENGELKSLQLCTMGSNNQWLNDDDVKSVVANLIEHGYFGDTSIYSYYLENIKGIEKPLSNN